MKSSVRGMHIRQVYLDIRLEITAACSVEESGQLCKAYKTVLALT